jgi:NAD(P)-dependent dehydrogenase (short-subunit alcohol dehydrogenase family)
MQYVVVTGVSTGIGRAVADDLVSRGYYVFGSVRKQADATALKDALGERFHPLIFDVTDAEAIDRAAEEVDVVLDGVTLDGLVNNAGIAVPGPLMELPIDDIRFQLEVNTIAPIVVTRAFIDMLGRDTSRRGGPGRLVMISSIAGERSNPFQGPYSASKHAMEALSDALRVELGIYGIDTIVVQPGPTQTAIWDKAEAIDITPYEQSDYYEALLAFRDMVLKMGRAGKPASEVADAVRKALFDHVPKTRYVVTPNKLMMYTLPKLLGDRQLDGFFSKKLGLKRKG